MSSSKEYLDLKSLAAYASCSIRWLRDRLHDPQHPLPHYRIGKKVLVKREAFEHWMEQYRVDPRREDLSRVVDEIVAAVRPGSGER